MPSRLKILKAKNMAQSYIRMEAKKWHIKIFCVNAEAQGGRCYLSYNEENLGIIIAIANGNRFYVVY